MTRILEGDREKNFLDKKSCTNSSLREKRKGLLSMKGRMKRRSKRKGGDRERC